MIKNNEKGITLVALVITVIVLLIIAGIAIAKLSGDNGILKQAKSAKTGTEEAKKDEENSIEDIEIGMREEVDGINKKECTLEESRDLIQKALDRLNEVKSRLERIRVLYIQASNYTLGENELKMNDFEVEPQKYKIKLLTTADYNGVYLLNGEFDCDIKNNNKIVNVKIPDVRLEALEISDINIITDYNNRVIENIIPKIEQAVSKVSEVISNLENIQSTLTNN